MDLYQLRGLFQPAEGITHESSVQLMRIARSFESCALELVGLLPPDMRTDAMVEMLASLKAMAEKAYVDDPRTGLPYTRPQTYPIPQGSLQQGYAEQRYPSYPSHTTGYAGHQERGYQEAPSYPKNAEPFNRAVDSLPPNRVPANDPPPHKIVVPAGIPAPVSMVAMPEQRGARMSNVAMREYIPPGMVFEKSKQELEAELAMRELENMKQQQ